MLDCLVQQDDQSVGVRRIPHNPEVDLEFARVDVSEQPTRSSSVVRRPYNHVS